MIGFGSGNEPCTVFFFECHLFDGMFLDEKIMRSFAEVNVGFAKEDFEKLHS